MTKSQKRRQKKLERRASQRKQRQKQLLKEKNRGLAERLAVASASPVVHCCATQTLWDQGISSVLISRQITPSKVAFAVFLVDVYCLGVKDAFGRIVLRGEYRAFYEKLAEEHDVVPLRPADLRKLVEGAVEYARDIGFSPHNDYHKVKPIFGDIDPDESTMVFEYGYEDGKPYFIAGPNDSPFRCEQVMATLERSCGPDGFHYTIPFDIDSLVQEREIVRIDAAENEIA